MSEAPLGISRRAAGGERAAVPAAHRHLACAPVAPDRRTRAPWRKARLW